jgi:hypothetical protein
MTPDGFTPMTVEAWAARPTDMRKAQAYHLARVGGRDSLEPVELIGEGADQQGLYALRLSHFPCRFVSAGDALLYTRKTA